MIELQKLLRENSSYWLDKLTQDPYNLKIIEKDNLVIFKYNQISSDMSLQVVQESRGIILEKDTWNIVCHPYHKFFNLGEPNAVDIDWDTAKAYEKIDGSLIKLYRYNDAWKTATNGTIDAQDAKLQMPITVEDIYGKRVIEDYFDLFVYTLGVMFGYDNVFEMFLYMDEKSTHLFELATPANKVVVPHKEYKLYYLSSKVNKTGEEYFNPDLMERFPTPSSYTFSSSKEILQAVENFPYDDEGYVVVDKNWNRLKVKSPAYLAIHHMKGEGAITEKKMLSLILANEGDEFLTYFPEFETMYTNLKNKLADLKLRMEFDAIALREMNRGQRSRKEIAIWANEKCILPAYIFQLLDKKVENVTDFIYSQRVEKLLEYMEKL
jgi:hypothetical protein